MDGSGGKKFPYYLPQSTLQGLGSIVQNVLKRSWKVIFFFFFLKELESD